MYGSRWHHVGCNARQNHRLRCWRRNRPHHIPAPLRQTVANVRLRCRCSARRTPYRRRPASSRRGVHPPAGATPRVIPPHMQTAKPSPLPVAQNRQQQTDYTINRPVRQRSPRIKGALKCWIFLLLQNGRRYLWRRLRATIGLSLCTANRSRSPATAVLGKIACASASTSCVA